MALYDVDKDVVLKYMPQLEVSGDTAPGTDEIDVGGEFLQRAGGDVHDALMEGGFEGVDTAALATTTTDITAYWIIHGAIAKRAALYYSDSISNLFDPDVLTEAWERSDETLESFASSNRIGQLSVSEGKQSGTFYHVDSTDDELDDGRALWDDEL